MGFKSIIAISILYDIVFYDTIFSDIVLYDIILYYIVFYRIIFRWGVSEEGSQNGYMRPIRGWSKVM